MNTQDIFIFDRDLIRKKRARCAKNFQNHNFLFDWTTKKIENRLADIKRTFPTTLQIGTRAPPINAKNFGIQNYLTLDMNAAYSPQILADEELLPFAPNSFDLITSALNLHTTNDLPGVLSQINQALKPDGLFIGALLGGETLYELRDVMAQADLAIHNGASPRVAPFADMPQMGALLQRATLNLPVIDSEKIIVTYDSPFKLFADLRGMGESNSLLQRHKKFTSRAYFQKLCALYHDQYSEPDERIRATFEVIFLLGWAPHDSQQKPLKRGSATARLSDVLNTTEGELPC